MIQDQQAKIQQAINLLNQAMGKNTQLPQQVQHTQQQVHTPLGQNTQANPQSAGFPLFEKDFKLFEAKGTQIGGQIAQLTQSVSNMFRISLNYTNYAKNSKKPDEPTMKRIQELLKSKAAGILSLQNDQKWRDHAKSAKQMINASFWIFTPAPDFTFQAAIESSQFQANKFRVQKVQPINQWFNLLLSAIKNLRKEVKQTYPNGVIYNFNGTGTWDGLLTVTLAPLQSTQVKQAPQPQTAKVQEKLVAPQPPAKKPPARENNNGNWFIKNYQGQTLDFTAQEALMRSTFFIQNCTKCIIKIDKSKIKSVVLNRSQNIELVIKDCISGVEIMNSKSVNLRILGFSPSISIDKSEKIYVVLNGQNKNTDIVSSKVTQLNISYTLNENGDIAKNQTVPEQIKTRWNEEKKKFENVVYDTFL